MKLSLSIFEIKSPKIFLGISLAIAAIFCAFQYWLYWPGYIQDDSQTSFLLLKSGWHPVIMAYLLEGLYKFFGYHIYHLFSLTLFPFYLGLWIIVYVVALRTKSWLSLLWFFPFFIGNVFFTYLKLGSSSFSMAWVFLLYAMTLALILTPIWQKRKKTFCVLYGIVFVIALLGRHNAIFQVWPVTFIWIGMFLADKNLSFWKYARKFIGWAFLSGLGCSVVLIGLNKALISSDEGNSYPATLIVMHQLVGTCAPKLDESCFKEEWWSDKWSKYISGERMYLLKDKYMRHSTDAETFSLSYDPDTVFKPFTNLEGRFEKLFYAIKKHPDSYYEHIKRYYNRLWGLWPNFVTQDKLVKVYTRGGMLRQAIIWNPTSDREKEQFWFLANQFPDKELSIKWTNTQKNIDTFIRDYSLSLNVIYFIRICYVLLFIGLCLFIRNRKNMLYLFMTSIAGSGFFTIVVLPFISPRVYIRYVEPMIICAVFALQLLLLILVLDRDAIFRFIKKCYGWLKALYSKLRAYKKK